MISTMTYHHNSLTDTQTHSLTVFLSIDLPTIGRTRRLSEQAEEGDKVEHRSDTHPTHRTGARLAKKKNKTYTLSR